MGSFDTNRYNPLNIQNLYDLLNTLRASVLATYQLCLGKIIIDPDSLYLPRYRFMLRRPIQRVFTFKDVHWKFRKDQVIN